MDDESSINLLRKTIRLLENKLNSANSRADDLESRWVFMRDMLENEMQQTKELRTELQNNKTGVRQKDLDNLAKKHMSDVRELNSEIRSLKTKLRHRDKKLMEMQQQEERVDAKRCNALDPVYL